MPDWDKDVISSNVSNVAYEAEGQQLIITWAKGRRSMYSGVPEDVALQLANAPSVGSMLNSDIKPYYPHQYV